jgi:RimJ/RimL family protein N-acetyltransferase
MAFLDSVDVPQAWAQVVGDNAASLAVARAAGMREVSRHGDRVILCGPTGAP